MLQSASIYGQNVSLSLDPLTFLIFLLPDTEQSTEGQRDARNLWLCMEANWETNSKKELGVGLFARADKFALRGQYRNYFNKARQSGVFIGLYGTVEYRKMFWLFDENNEFGIGWNFPFIGNDNVYHSIGLSAGFDVGFRIRIGDVGITPYIGLGIPLYVCFGDLPPENNREEFYSKNTTFRAIDIGLRVDFFIHKQD
jgi:hypothetical protein